MIMDVDSLGGLPEGSLLLLSNAELADQLLSVAKGSNIDGQLFELIDEAAQRLIYLGD